MPPAVIFAGAAIGGAFLESRSARKQAQAGERAAKAGIAEQRAARESFESRTDPFRELGLQGSELLQNFLSDPTAGLEEINPIVAFLREQGFEQIQESAASRGRLGAGGTLRDLTRFDVGLTSTIVPQLQNQRFNQLFNVASLGANVAAGQGTAGLQTASNIGNLLTTGARSTQAGIAGQTSAITGGLENLAAVPGAFPNIFGETPPPPRIPSPSQLGPTGPVF